MSWNVAARVSQENYPLFLNAIRSDPSSGKVLEKLTICSDYNNDKDKPTGIFVDNELRDVINLCPNLLKLDMYRCLSLTNEGLKQIASLAKLKSLNLSCCTATNDEVVISLRDKYIVKLNLLNCYKITDKSLEIIGSDMYTLKYNLRVLCLTNCTNITNEGLKSISSLEELELLDITGCQKITDEGLRHLLKLPRLKTLRGIDSEVSLPNTSAQMRTALRIKFGR
jgi:hypothetical protein